MPCGYHLEETIAQYSALRAESGAFPPQWDQVTAVLSGRVYAVDGTAYFSRPGPRLVDGLEILHAILSDSDFDHLPNASVARLT